MTDTPDIVIRSHEEREAEDAARWCLAEMPSFQGAISLRFGRKADAEKETENFLVFADIETAIAWASVRARELSLEGVEVYTSKAKEMLHRFPGRRFSGPIDNYRRPALNEMLQW